MEKKWFYIRFIGLYQTSANKLLKSNVFFGVDEDVSKHIDFLKLPSDPKAKVYVSELTPSGETKHREDLSKEV